MALHGHNIQQLQQAGGNPRRAAAMQALQRRQGQQSQAQGFLGNFLAARRGRGQQRPSSQQGLALRSKLRRQLATRPR